MDIFNKKRVEELERQLEEVNTELAELRMWKSIQIQKFEKMSELKEEIPESCTRGPWCKACEFSKVYHYTDSWYSNAYEVVFCNKANVCKEFTPKETSKCSESDRK